uniref:Uncharacterized protein n=1 Tax=Pararge aegeria TaxID=116150 RepID=S4PWR3_9NEOP
MFSHSFIAVTLNPYLYLKAVSTRHRAGTLNRLAARLFDRLVTSHGRTLQLTLIRPQRHNYAREVVKSI